jgi:quercetin dioxygenase-like cupin family protein
MQYCKAHNIVRCVDQKGCSRCTTAGLLGSYVAAAGVGIAAEWPRRDTIRSGVMKVKVSAAILICCATLGAFIVEPSAALFENDQVKVVRALEKPHVKAPFHEHKLNRVMIYLQPGRQRFEYQDGRQPGVFDWTAGEVKWSAAGGLHAPEVVSNDPFNIIEIELKKPGTGEAVSSSLDPIKVDPKHYKLEFENAQVRVLRVQIEPHGTAPMHQHSLNRITVFLTDQDFRVTDSNGRAQMTKHKAGDAVWGTPTTHTEENLSNQPFEVVAVELKN